MPYCYLPWTNIDISPQGEISPCCKFLNRSYPYKTPNINDISIDEYLENNTLKEVKKNFTDGVWPKGCDRCKIEEENGIQSRRLIEQNRWQEHYQNHDKKGFISASIAFGNACNLTCITCSSYASSLWFKEYQKIHGISIKPNIFYKKDFVNNFYKHASNLIHLDIPGGEPFISGVDQQKELLLLMIKDGKAKDISLHYNTNCTIFPNNEWLELWDHFKEVDIQLSLDATKNKFEYIRYPAVWNEVEDNALHYKDIQNKHNNIKLTISSTVSAYNISYLDDIINWSRIHQFEAQWLGRVHDPIYFRPTVWKTKAKEYIIKTLNESKNDHQSFINLLRTEDVSDRFDTFRNLLLRHDQYRNLSFKSTFPEMFTFLAE